MYQPGWNTEVCLGTSGLKGIVLVKKKPEFYEHGTFAGYKSEGHRCAPKKISVLVENGTGLLKLLLILIWPYLT